MFEARLPLTTLVVACIVCPVVSADEIDPIAQIQVAWGDSGNTWVSTPATIGEVTKMGDGSYHVVGSRSTPDWNVEWVLELGGSTGISSDISVTNPHDFTQTFDFTVSRTSAVALPAPTTSTGSVVVNVADTFAQGQGFPEATVAAVSGGSAYKALVNSQVLGNLLDHPLFSLTAPEFGTNSHGPDTFKNNAGPAVNIGDEIAIRHEFTLTARDTAQFAGTFVVPEPTCLSLLALGALALLRRTTC